MTKLPSIFSKNDSSEQPKCQKSSDEIFKMVNIFLYIINGKYNGIYF